MRSFRFKLVPFIAMLLLVAVGVAAGRWQTGRAHEKGSLVGQTGGRRRRRAAGAGRRPRARRRAGIPPACA
ncbi:hypothetical protein ACHMW6_04230 [Pseudoduganella sp. UC29_106]|uniref:hypothetical protein n=1 Tax=Pseudoduganella sp. UC29_106 TaxID=3374553 RepID=UPI0037576F27